MTVTGFFAAAALLLGDGTCGTYSPDGNKLAYQRTVGGLSRVAVMDRTRGTVEEIEPGPGHAAYPAWHPSGTSLVYTYGHETKTAWDAKDGTSGYHLRIWHPVDGIREITAGRVRDYMPSFSPDGKTLFFASTRGASPRVLEASRASIFSVSAAGGEPACRVKSTVNNMGMGQPVLSPDGRFLAFARIDNFRDVWHLMCARVEKPDACCRVTPKGQHAYAPRWTPDGRYLVYTGFSRGDPGWGVYVLDPRSGGVRRLCDGRNPDVHPSGDRLVYDDGTRLFERPFGPADRPDSAVTAEVRDEAVRTEGERVVWRAEKPSYPAKEAMDGRFVFGTARTFFVRARILFRAAATPRFRHYVTGAYEGAPLGFELFVDGATPKFGVRESSGLYMGVASGRTFKDGKTYTLTGVRTQDALFVRVDETRPDEFRFSGTYPLDRPQVLSVGPTLTGTDEIVWAEVGTGWPSNLPRPATRAEIFGGETKP